MITNDHINHNRVNSNVWSEPSVRWVSTSVSVGVCMCSVVAMQADPSCADSAADVTHKCVNGMVAFRLSLLSLRASHLFSS